jgi:hypothetical protein
MGSSSSKSTQAASQPANAPVVDPLQAAYDAYKQNPSIQNISILRETFNAKTIALDNDIKELEKKGRKLGELKSRIVPNQDFVVAENIARISDDQKTPEEKRLMIEFSNKLSAYFAIAQTIVGGAKKKSKSIKPKVAPKAVKGAKAMLPKKKKSEGNKSTKPKKITAKSNKKNATKQSE